MTIIGQASIAILLLVLAATAAIAAFWLPAVLCLGGVGISVYNIYKKIKVVDRGQ